MGVILQLSTLRICYPASKVPNVKVCPGSPNYFSSKPVGAFQRGNQVSYVDPFPYVMVYETHVFYWENMIYSRNAKILFGSFTICLVYA